jgi:tetratricopeptide (TPR) repeat protein
MSQYDEIQVSEWLREGVAAAKAGRRVEARALLMQVVEANEHSEQGWLWLSGVVDTDEDRLICLENVLTLNPDNVQARAGLKWLRERGVVAEPPVEEALEAGPVREGYRVEGEQPDARAQEALDDVHAVQYAGSPGPQASAGWEPEQFMTSDGCVYCGLLVGDQVPHCPHCGGRLRAQRFKLEERSVTGQLLPAYWLVIAVVNFSGFVLISFDWEIFVDNVADRVPTALGPYVADVLSQIFSYVLGPALDDVTSTEVSVVRYSLLGLAVLGTLVALGLFLRRPLAHMLGLGLVALHFVAYVALFALGFLGIILAAIEGILTIFLTMSMFQTVEDYSKELYWERLEPDRHLLNDLDYYRRGRVYAQRGMWAKALLHWRRAAAKNSQRDTFFAATAQAYAHLGHYEEALTQVDTAIRVSRTPEDWQRLRQAIAEAQQRAVAGAEG